MPTEKLINHNSGFTLIELLVSTAIIIGLFMVVGNYLLNILNFQNYLTPSFEVQQELQSTIQEMRNDLLTMNYSSLGSYPIADVSTTSITFFTDIEGDGILEQVRFFLDGTTLKKGVISPTGNPLVYNSNDEVIIDKVHNVVSTTSSIFLFYDSDYTGSEDAMTYPIDISNIKIIGVDISAKQNSQNKPISASMRVAPRNVMLNF